MYRISCLYTTKRIRRSDCFAIGTVYWQFWHVCNKVFYKIVGKTRVWLHENPITESGKIVHKPRKQNLLYLGDLHMSPGTTDIRWGNCLYCISSRKSTPTPKFFGTAKAYFVCNIGTNFQISFDFCIHWVSVVPVCHHPSSRVGNYFLRNTL